MSIFGINLLVFIIRNYIVEEWSTKLVYPAYAQNFRKDSNHSHKYLVWFAKLKNYRYYSHKDPEVKQGLKKRGDRKDGAMAYANVQKNGKLAQREQLGRTDRGCFAELSEQIGSQ